MESDAVSTVHEALGQATFLVTRFLFDRADLSPTASDVLYRLHTDGPARLTALAAAVDISQPSMTQLVQRLERRGLVARSPDPDDRRASRVALTDGGLRLVGEHEEGARRRLATAMAQLSEGDLRALHLAAQVVLPILANLADSARDVAATAP